MYLKRTILLGAAFASFCSYPMPAAEASRHASTQAGTTVVNTSPMQAGRTGATTRTFSERIRAILSQSDEKPLSGPARPSNVLHQWPVEYKDEGGTLLFSDSPEYVTTEGILYRDTVTGDARVLYYHLNNTDEPKKVAVVLENKYPGPNQVRVTRGGSGAPSEDYLAVGKQGQMDYWGKALDQVINLPAGGARLLQEQIYAIPPHETKESDLDDSATVAIPQRGAADTQQSEQPKQRKQTKQSDQSASSNPRAGWR